MTKAFSFFKSKNKLTIAIEQGYVSLIWGSMFQNPDSYPCTCVIDQPSTGQDGWILAKFYFCVFMDQEEFEVHKNAKKASPLLLAEPAIYPPHGGKGGGCLKRKV